MPKPNPLQSKKFVAYLIAEMTWKIILFGVLMVGVKEAKIDVFVGSIALAIVIIAGFIETVYIGNQSALDKYTRIAEIAAGAGKNFSMKGINMVGHETTTDPSDEQPEDDG